MKRNFKLIIALCIILCVFSCSVTVFAEPDTVADEVELTELVTQAPVSTTAPETEEDTQPAQTEADTTDDNLVPSDYETPESTTEEKKTTESSGGSVTVATPSTTRKSSKTEVSTTRKQNNTTNNNRDDDEDESREVVSFSEEETLPDGQFYIYAEKNNGTERLKMILDEPSLIAEPSTPVREGFVFDGWYKDPEFKEPWMFYTDLAQEGTVIYAKWVADPNAVVYKVTVKQTPGGTIEVNPSVASVGEPIVITVNAESGMRLVSGSITVNGEKTDFLSFSMPAKDVVVSGSFEAVPDSEVDTEKPSVLPFIIGAIVLLVAVVVAIVVLVIRRRNMFSEDEIDENGTVIDDDDDDKSWVDESIVVEDGFKNGEKVIGNFVPESDYEIDSEEE